MKHSFLRSGASLACCALLLTLSACGGSDDNGAPPASPPPGSGSGLTPVAFTGKVFLIGPVANAVVCVDRNMNNVCDASEPVSAKTGVDGTYSITYTPTDSTAAAELAAAPVIAQITAGYPTNTAASYDTVDTTRIEDSAVLKAPAGKQGQINPLTTLIQSGIASGLSIGKAEAAVALQLAIPVADAYDYQSLPPFDATTHVDNARLMALVAWYALAEANFVTVTDPASVTSPAASDQLASLNFTDTNNYSVRTFPTTGIVDTDGRTNLVDTRDGLSSGAATAHDVLYPTLRLAPSGWVRCDEASTFTSTLGSPSRSDNCGGATKSVGYTKSISDISGKKMVDVVTAMQSQGTGNTIIGVNPATAFADPSVVFPTGSTLRFRENVELLQSYYINNSNADQTSFTSLVALVNGRQNGGVTPSTGAGTFGLGILDDTHLLRAAFLDTVSAVQYYKCDSVAPYTTFNNCVTITATGTFTIHAVNGAQIMDFGNYPTTNQPYIRGMGEYSGIVYSVRQTRSDNQYNESSSNRLNGTAWVAMRAQLGL